MIKYMKVKLDCLFFIILFVLVLRVKTYSQCMQVVIKGKELFFLIMRTVNNKIDILTNFSK